MKEPFKFKIVFIGDSKCGKTCLIKRIMSNKFNQEYKPTTFNTYPYNRAFDKYSFNINLWDTSGNDRCDVVRPLVYAEDTDLVLLCFSVVCPKSYERIRIKWSAEAKRYCPNKPLLLVGCKSDLRYDPVFEGSILTYGQIISLQTSIGAEGYVETSAVLPLLFPFAEGQSLESVSEFLNTFSLPLTTCPNPVTIALPHMLTGKPRKALLYGLEKENIPRKNGFIISSLYRSKSYVSTASNKRNHLNSKSFFIDTSNLKNNCKIM